MSSQKLDKQVLSQGNGSDYPKKGDQVAMIYTGWLYDANATNNRGTKYVDSTQSSQTTVSANVGHRFDSSVGKGDFLTPIGVGRVIQGMHG